MTHPCETTHSTARGLRILLVTWYFPPANTIAAVRLNKLATYLDAQGHDVRVVTARDIPVSQGLTSDLDTARVTYAPWTDVQSRAAGLWGRLKRLRPGQPTGTAVSDPAAAAATPSRETATSGRKPLRRHLRELLFFPDYELGWIPHGIRAGRRLSRAWQPDLVYASGPPFSTLVIGWRLARRLQVPLVSEFRDRWSDDPYYPPSELRQRLDRWLERRIVRDSRGLVTVSEPWARTYRQRFGKPVHVLYNGFDPDLVDPARASLSEGGPLRIVYTGGIYPGRRDPSMLFDAIARLGADPDAIRVDFYGTKESHVRPLAETYRVTACVQVHPPVPQPDAVRRQLDADVLLLMQWQDPREQGNVPGKLFEYLGARRPILLIGLDGGVPHEFIEARGAGALARDPEHVAGLLRDWLAQKRETGRIPLLPETVSAGLSHADQLAHLPDFLERDLGLASTATKEEA